MDDQRFDELTRRLADPRSRRGVLKVLTGGIVAGLGALAGQRRATVAQETCTADADCADDEICCAGACRNQQCCIDDEDPNARCPEGTSCFEGVCDPVDEPAEGACDTDGNCADDEICCAGTCRAIECCIDEDDPNARCPEGTSCFEGVCDPIEEPDGDACEADGNCADDEICCAGVCRAIECCIDEEDPNARCPEGTSCFEGVCDPVEDNDGDDDDEEPVEDDVETPAADDDDDAPAVAALPSTGAGPGTTGSNAPVAGLLAAGAVAALAARKLQQRSAEPGTTE